MSDLNEKISRKQFLQKGALTIFSFLFVSSAIWNIAKPDKSKKGYSEGSYGG